MKKPKCFESWSKSWPVLPFRCSFLDPDSTRLRKSCKLKLPIRCGNRSSGSPLLDFNVWLHQAFRKNEEDEADVKRKEAGACLLPIRCC